MNGVHDLGYMEGMGPVGPTGWEPQYHAEWEKHAWAFFPFSARGGMFGLDEFRKHLENMHPLHYFTARYYEHWVEATEQIGEKKGYWTRADLDKRTEYYLEYPDAPLPPNDDPALVQFAAWAVENGFSSARTLEQGPKYGVGDLVRIDDSIPSIHHRRPRYAMGRVGKIVLHHGPHVFPDTAGNGQGETAEHLYTVRIEHTEILGNGEGDPRTAQYVDMWEPYLTVEQGDVT